MYFGTSVALGAPVWWLLRDVHPLSGVQLPQLVMFLDPAAPTFTGEDVMVSVTSTPTGAAVSNATVTVIWEGSPVFKTSTNERGVATIKFAGEPTIIRAEKDGYQPAIAVLPKVPAAWVRDSIIGFGSAVISGPVTALIAYRLGKRSKATKRKRS